MNNQKVVWRDLLAAATIAASLSVVAESEQSETSDAALSQCIEEAKGGLLTFTAVYEPQNNETPAAEPEGGYPDLNVVLRLEADSERVLGLIKDLESKTDLMPTIAATEDGATQMTFTVADNDDSKDLDPTGGVIRDPAGVSVVPLASLIGPSVPVPLMGQFFLLLLGGGLSP